MELKGAVPVMEVLVWETDSVLISWMGPNLPFWWEGKGFSRSKSFLLLVIT